LLEDDRLQQTGMSRGIDRFWRKLRHVAPRSGSSEPKLADAPATVRFTVGNTPTAGRLAALAVPE
jgi:hypothetical protein